MFKKIYVYVLGNQTAVPKIWLDIMVIPLEGAALFTTWYLFIARKDLVKESQVFFMASCYSDFDLGSYFAMNNNSWPIFKQSFTELGQNIEKSL